MPGDLDVTERIVGEIASLPMFPQLTDAQVERIVEVTASWRPAT